MTAVNTRLFSFVGGLRGAWSVVAQRAVTGDPLPSVRRLDLNAGSVPLPGDVGWRLRGVVSHDRYVERSEKDRLVAVQPGLRRPDASRVALIPIRKTPPAPMFRQWRPSDSELLVHPVRSRPGPDTTLGDAPSACAAEQA